MLDAGADKTLQQPFMYVLDTKLPQEVVTDLVEFMCAPPAGSVGVWGADYLDGGLALGGPKEGIKTMPPLKIGSGWTEARMRKHLSYLVGGPQIFDGILRKINFGVLEGDSVLTAGAGANLSATMVTGVEAATGVSGVTTTAGAGAHLSATTVTGVEAETDASGVTTGTGLNVDVTGVAGVETTTGVSGLTTTTSVTVTDGADMGVSGPTVGTEDEKAAKKVAKEVAKALAAQRLHVFKALIDYFNRGVLTYYFIIYFFCISGPCLYAAPSQSNLFLMYRRSLFCSATTSCCCCC